MAVIVGDENENVIIGTGNVDTLFGRGGDDFLKGGGGNDALIGGAGDDTMLGGAGDDVYVVDDEDDAVIEYADQGTDWVETHVDFVLGEHVENLRMMGSADIDAAGNNKKNVMYGNSGDNDFDGGGDADYMKGEGGNDNYFVDHENDVCVEDPGEGIDAVFSKVTHYLGQFFENLTLEGFADINGSGNSSNNTIVGNAGDNTLWGGQGQDHLTGGAGADTFEWTWMSESGLDSATVDVVTDFDAAQGDRIDVSIIDANPLMGGDQAFTFVGTADYSDVAQIRVVTDGIDTYLAFNTDYNPDNDGAIRLVGLMTPQESWFEL
jgi:Ca2+-binding RTX toxin-like protein